MLNQQGLKQIGLNELDQLSLLVAALAHDVGHDGFSNGFHHDTCSERYKLFNTTGTQEFYHSATTISLLEQKDNDFLPKDLTPTARRLFKKRVLVSILNTDMVAHKELEKEMKKQFTKM